MNKQPQPTYSESEDLLCNLRSELVKTILEENISLAWDQAYLEDETVLSEIEDNFALCDCLDDDELTRGTEKLFAHLNDCWNTIDAQRSVVKRSLLERFGQFVPSHQLDKIVHQAQDIISLNLSPIEQLIQCVKPLLSNWSEDDLQIFARPLVYAMRGATEFKQAPWDELSEIDQVRLTMKIAQEAIRQFQSEPSHMASDLDG